MTIKKAIIILVLVAVIGIGAFGYFYSKRSKTAYTTVNAETGKIIQTVSETGTVKSSGEINLSFLNAGKIEKILFKIGDKVKKDDLLAQLDYSALNLNKKEAQANLEVAKQSLNKLMAGATAEDTAVAYAGVQQAKTAYDSAYNEMQKVRKTVNETIAQAQKKYDDLRSNASGNETTYEQAIVTAEASLSNTKLTYQRAIDNSRDNALTALEDKLSKANTALDIINTTLNNEDAKDYIGVNNKSYLINTKDTYNAARRMLNEAITDLHAAQADPSANGNTAKALSSGESAVSKTFTDLDYCYKALENSITTVQFTQTELDALKAGISAQQTIISAAISVVQAAKQAFDSAVLSYDTNVTASTENLNQAKVAYDNAVKDSTNALTNAKLSGDQQVTAAESRTSSALKSMQLAQSQLNKTVAKPTSYDISLSQAKVSQAQAAIDSVSKQIENSLIKAPIDGTITKSNFEVGEQVTPSATVISMITANNFEIEVLISEADIAKLKVGDKSEITLDAFGDDIKFNGTMTFIEPAETVLQGVIYYKVNVNFEPGTYQVKSGMTANVTIVCAEKENVLRVPSRAVIQKEGDGKIVRILLNGKDVQERSVEVGLAGDEGLVEILSGLKAGEVVVTAIKESGK